MTRAQRLLFIVAGIALLAAIVFRVVSQPVLHWAVTKKLPQGVAIKGKIDLRWRELVLHEVTVDREWVHGTLTEVHIARDESIDVRGGSLTVDVDKRPASTGEGSKRHVVASGLSITGMKGGITGNALGVSWDGAQVCFETGDVTHPRVTVHLTTGCYTRSPSEVFTAKTASTHLDKLPKIPGIPLTDVDVRVTDIEVTRPEHLRVQVKAGSFEAGPLSATGARYTFSTDGLSSLWALTLTVQHPWLDAEPATLKDILVQVPEDHHEVTLLLGWEKPALGAGIEARLAEGPAPDYKPIPGEWRIHSTEKCQGWVDSLPESMKDGPLKSLQFTGMFSFMVTTKPPTLALDAECKAVCKNFPDLRKPFTHIAYKADGTLIPDMPSGPGTPHWISLKAMGPMPMAVVNMEDASFPYHKGYLANAFQESLIENVEKGGFVRGGSTITQQTAKNLWLRREKTIGRKVAELFLSQALESCLTKDQILETYLNIIEFGPDVYGIGPGAKYWFDKTPDELTPTEAFWLASILPSPKKARKPTDDDLKRIDKLMASLAMRGRIPDVGMNDGPIDTTGWEINQ